ncbi:hypothetical protein ACQKWADRAFT_289037 [Trichoderma austrokoningii]
MANRYAYKIPSWVSSVCLSQVKISFRVIGLTCRFYLMSNRDKPSHCFLVGLRPKMKWTPDFCRARVIVNLSIPILLQALQYELCYRIYSSFRYFMPWISIYVFATHLFLKFWHVCSCRKLLH